jgi:hypothetical protein
VPNGDWPGPLLVTELAVYSNDPNIPEFEDRIDIFSDDDEPKHIQRRQGAVPSMNWRLIRDPAGKVYQINSLYGILSMEDGSAVVPPGRIYRDRHPRGSGPAVVEIGLIRPIDPLGPWGGRPISDAVFGSDGFLYVAPVVVTPTPAGSGSSYLATARLELPPDPNLPYRVVDLYDCRPPDNDNLIQNVIREIELDDQGNLYVFTGHALNASSMMYVFDVSDSNSVVPVPLGILDPNKDTPYIPMPSSAHYCPADQTLYLASTMNTPDPKIQRTDSVLYRLAGDNSVSLITINGMGQITGITSDPSGNVWVVGFISPIHPDKIDDTNQTPFFQPCVAKIRPRDIEHQVLVHAHLLPSSGSSGDSTALPLSVLWVGSNSGCDKADLDQDGIVNFLDFVEMAAKWVSTYNLQDLRNLAEHWLERCR